VTDSVTLDLLLAAIQHEPSRDDLRLAYAAALTERGDPRGEFITIQCQRHASGTRRKGAREKQLLDANRSRWLGRLRTAIAGNGVEFERGFVAAIEIDGNSYLDEVSEEWSTVERLHFRDTGSRFSSLLAEPCLRGLRTVTGAHAAHVAALVTVEHTLPVVELSFGETFSVVCLHDQVVAALKVLMGGRAMPELRTLGMLLSKTETLDSLPRLLRSEAAQRLRHLVVAGRSSDWAELTKAVQELAPWLESLEIRWEPHHRASDRTHWCARLTRGQDRRLSRFTLEMMKDATGRMSVYWANNRKRTGLPYEPFDDALVGFDKFSPGMLTAIDIIANKRFTPGSNHWDAIAQRLPDAELVGKAR
jgi:uncharacterized protein (TIGR02996 family)